MKRETALKEVYRAGAFAVTVLLLSGCGQSSGAGSNVQTRTLSNGVRVALVHFPKSTNVSLFTFLPMGLASDAPERAQWAHLVEHLVIRSTFPDDLTQANAETMPDNMRLDFYGHTGNWKEGLAHHKRWLEGMPFNEATLTVEKHRVNAECDFTAKNFATHKFALAAWAQGSRHGRTRVELKGDVQRASLQDVQQYRDARLFVPAATTVCLVGGVDAETFFAEADRQLGQLKSQATPASPVRTSNFQPRTLNLEWDLDGRHLVLTWPIPDFSQDDYAALLAAAQWLNTQFFSDAPLKEETGQVFAGTDLATPEGNFFYVSASFRSSAAFEEVQKKIQAQIARLTTTSSVLAQIPMLGQQLAFSLMQVPDIDALQSQAPPGMSRAMIEGNAGLQLCLNVHRYGLQREGLAKKLSKQSPLLVRQAAAKYLTGEKNCVATIRPTTEATRK